MPTTILLAVAPFTCSDQDIAFTEVEIGRPASRRGAGPYPDDRAIPHRTHRADDAARGDAPDRDAAPGTGVVKAVGAEVQGIEVADHVVMSFRSSGTRGPCTAGDDGYSENHIVHNNMGMRMYGSAPCGEARRRCSVSSFGQSSFARHAVAYDDNFAVVLRRPRPHAAGTARLRVPHRRRDRARRAPPGRRREPGSGQ